MDTGPEGTILIASEQHGLPTHTQKKKGLHFSLCHLNTFISVDKVITQINYRKDCDHFHCEQK